MPDYDIKMFIDLKDIKNEKGVDSLRNDVKEIYLKYKSKCENLNDYYIKEQTRDTPRKSYVYEWFTNDGKIFYVGKGTGNRINHILYDELKSNKNDKIYEYLRSTYGISSRKVYENLTDQEACILEIYQIWKRENEGEVLLQVVDADSYYKGYDKFAEAHQNDKKPPIFIMPYHRRYFNYSDKDFFFDDVNIDEIKGVLLQIKNLELKNKCTTLFTSLRKKIYQSYAQSVELIIVDEILSSTRLKFLKEKGYKIIHFNQIRDYCQNSSFFIVEPKKEKTILSFDISFLDSLGFQTPKTTFDECYNTLNEDEKSYFNNRKIDYEKRYCKTIFYDDGVSIPAIGSEQLLYRIINECDNLFICAKFDGYIHYRNGSNYDHYYQIALQYYRDHDLH